MRFTIDENLPIEIADLLRQYHHDALSVLDQHLGGHPDRQVARHCLAEQRAIVTLDLDYSDILQYPPETYFGIIVLRPDFQTIPVLLQLMARVIALLDQEPLDGHLWTVDEHRVRIRGSSTPGNP